MAGATLVRDLVAGSLVEGTFAVTRKRKRARKDGRPYLDLELADRSGRVAGRVWEAVPLLDGRFEVGDTVRVLGRVSEYAGRVELELRDVERVEGGDPLELVPGRAAGHRAARRLRRVPVRRDARRRAARAWPARCSRSPPTASASAPHRRPSSATTPTPAA